MAALDTLTGFATNPAALTAITMNAGDSLTIRSAPMEARPQLLNVWASNATAGALRIRSPRLHDFQQGIKLGIAAATPHPLLPRFVSQDLWPLDLLTVEIIGGGAEVDALQMLVYYPNLPGSSANLHTLAEVMPRIQNIVTVETTATGSGTAAAYGGTTALNAGTADLLKANVYYAILGFIAPANVLGVSYRGPDFSNLRCSGPGAVQRIETRAWFADVARETGFPTIPVFNAANKGSTFVEFTDVALSTSRTIQTICAELDGQWSPPA